MKECNFVACKKLVKGKKHCSKTCANLNRWGATDFGGRVKKKTCTNCGCEFEVRRSQKERQRITCSPKCKAARISATHTDKVVSEAQKEKQRKAMTGRTLTKEHREAIGKGVAGKNNRHWIDGRSWEKEGAGDYNFEFTTVLKTTIKKRDGFKCRKCDEDGTNFSLFVHHIDMDKHNNSEDNLVTVCHSCHSKIHGGTLSNEF